jgi:hypothetical protein
VRISKALFPSLFSRAQDSLTIDNTLVLTERKLKLRACRRISRKKYGVSEEISCDLFKMQEKGCPNPQQRKTTYIAVQGKSGQVDNQTRYF